MAIFRVEKTKNYTVMSNYHLRDKSINLKAKGLLSYMLSLPDDWDYTEEGLAANTGEGLCSLRTALKQLEENGYLIRQRIRRDNGTLKDMEYTIYEIPRSKEAPPISENLILDKPKMDKPIAENLTIINTKKTNTDKQNTESINPSVSDNATDGTDGSAKTPTHEDIYSTYEQIIRDNVDVELFAHELATLDRRAEAEDLTNDEYDAEFNYINPDTLAQIIQYMTDIVSGHNSKPIMIYDTPVPRSVVVSKLLKVNHFQMKNCIHTLNTQHNIHNRRNYALSVLYNS